MHPRVWRPLRVFHNYWCRFKPGVLLYASCILNPRNLTEPWNHVVVLLMKEWSCSSSHYLQSAMPLPMWSRLERPEATAATGRDWFRPSCVCLHQRSSQQPRSISEIRGSAEKPDVLTWLFLLHYWSAVVNLRWGYGNKYNSIINVSVESRSSVGEGKYLPYFLMFEYVLASFLFNFPQLLEAVASAQDKLTSSPHRYTLPSKASFIFL